MFCLQDNGSCREAMIDITTLKFDEKGLIPTIVVDAQTGKVLMLANMNAESLQISIDEGKTCFWSRSRNELWRKGETSGNVQHVVSINADCDKDALVVTVKKNGPACHTGADSCFEQEGKPFSIDTLYGIITDRKATKKPGSYTTYLFEKGLDKILKKFGEESTEVIIAAKSDDKAETIYELADLTYHALVLMTEMGISPEDIKKELA
ncbi:MAG: bifunctional phosphoribosyl-AMP cyclohydrolase/phosphoribosyl-ATP diphosphatase HisIE [Oscillospiraceae bacterium]|jgi:phosphoribosyl-ATP pyrophosphohydrolase/phosphoribosyl-AMP cyclohydrolase|nr:bifunctional phosphoribosyl-AMP cyclohydrolase/phosphoribosyl-ATP diphosphatase HisIE [Oscillospiraceae bacterium]